jgi:hypothetical protein
MSVDSRSAGERSTGVLLLIGGLESVKPPFPFLRIPAIHAFGTYEVPGGLEFTGDTLDPATRLPSRRNGLLMAKPTTARGVAGILVRQGRSDSVLLADPIIVGRTVA